MLGLRRASVAEETGAYTQPEIRPSLWYRLGVIESNSAFRMHLVGLLEGSANPRAFSSLSVMLAKAGDSAVAIVVGPSSATPTGFAEIARALQTRPGTVVVLALPGPASNQVQKAAAFAGISEIVDLSRDGGALINIVEAAVSALPAHVTAPPQSARPTAGGGGGGGTHGRKPPTGGGRGGNGGGGWRGDEDPFHMQHDDYDKEDYKAAHSATSQHQRIAIEAPTDRGRIVSVFSTKGGTGKSVIACNIAVELARTSFWPVVLVDADLQLGDVAVMLKVHPRHTLADAITRIDRLDATMLQQMLSRHEGSQLLVLPSPFEPEFSDDVKSSEVLRVIDMLCSFAGHVVIDTSSHLGDVNLALFEKSDDIVVVAGMDIAAIKDVKAGVEILRRLRIPMERMRLVLNRADAKARMKTSEVERVIGLPADAMIPSSVLIPRSLNNRTPVLEDAPKSDVSKSIMRLASMFLQTRQGKRQ